MDNYALSAAYVTFFEDLSLYGCINTCHIPCLPRVKRKLLEFLLVHFLT